MPKGYAARRDGRFTQLYRTHMRGLRPAPSMATPQPRMENSMETNNDNTSTAQPRRQGRRWMKRFAIGSAIAVAIAGTTFAIFGHRHGWHHGGPVDPARVEAHVDWMLKRFYSRIDATDEQKQKIGPIVQAAAKDLLPMREQLRAARGKAAALLEAPTVDRAAVEQLRLDQMKLADDASKRLTQALADTAEVLTPAQRRELAERLGRFSRHRAA